MSIRDDPKRHTYQGEGPLCSWCEQVAAVHRGPFIPSETAIICYSRCMWCGRRTPHEWCHACTAVVNAGGSPRSDFWRFDEPAEECLLSDEACPETRITR